MARNQYRKIISKKCFPVFARVRIQARHGDAPKNNFPQEFGQYAENDSSKIFSYIRASANTGPACIREKKLIPRDFFPACIGFVPGGIKAKVDAAFLLTVRSFLLTMELFLLTVDNLAFLLTIGAFFAYSFSFFTYSWSFVAYSGKVRLIRAFRDCQQRSLTASKPNFRTGGTVSTKDQT